jgi:hypothetical protein
VEGSKPSFLSRTETEVIQTAEGLAVLQESPHLTGRKRAQKVALTTRAEAFISTSSSQLDAYLCDTAPKDAQSKAPHWNGFGW